MEEDGVGGTPRLTDLSHWFHLFTDLKTSVRGQFVVKGVYYISHTATAASFLRGLGSHSEDQLYCGVPFRTTFGFRFTVIFNSNPISECFLIIRTAHASCTNLEPIIH